MSNLTKKGQRDLILVNRALKEGDRMAYNELMKLYRDPLYFMLYEKVNDQEVAKDLTIEVHESGSAVAGTYSHEIAEQKCAEATTVARAQGHPLQLKVKQVE